MARRHVLSILLCMLLLSTLSTSASEARRFTRFETTYTPEVHSCQRNAGVIAERIHPGMTRAELWFVTREIEFLNGGNLFSGDPLVVPVYQVYTETWKKVCSDLRNWFVAVHKGNKYRVSPALLVAIRSHENPEDWCGCESKYRRGERDRYAYGVVVKKYTDLWTQAEYGARIVARIAKKQGWDPTKPTQARLYRLALVYVGQGRASARHWSESVITMYRRALP